MHMERYGAKERKTPSHCIYENQAPFYERLGITDAHLKLKHFKTGRSCGRLTDDMYFGMARLYLTTLCLANDKNVESSMFFVFFFILVLCVLVLVHF
jgi:hypothetical protein